MPVSIPASLQLPEALAAAPVTSDRFVTVLIGRMHRGTPAVGGYVPGTRENVTVTVGTGGAASGATTVPLDNTVARTKVIPAGARFKINNVPILVTADVSTSATSMSVAKLTAALAANDTGTYVPMIEVLAMDGISGLGVTSQTATTNFFNLPAAVVSETGDTIGQVSIQTKMPASNDAMQMVHDLKNPIVRSLIPSLRNELDVIIGDNDGQIYYGIAGVGFNRTYNATDNITRTILCDFKWFGMVNPAS